LTEGCGRRRGCQRAPGVARSELNSFNRSNNPAEIKHVGIQTVDTDANLRSEANLCAIFGESVEDERTELQDMEERAVIVQDFELFQRTLRNVRRL